MINLIEQYSIQGPIEIVFHDQHNKKLDIDALTFIDMLCKQYGSSYEGRKSGSCYLLQIHQKPPILISDHTKDILFPLFHLRREKNIWLNYRAIDQVRKRKDNSEVIFLDDSRRIISVDIRTIRRELKLCEELLYRIQQDHWL